MLDRDCGDAGNARVLMQVHLAVGTTAAVLLCNLTADARACHDATRHQMKVLITI
jgi:hypothetical protein